MIKILIVEDQVIMRDSLANLINGQEDMQVVGSIGSAGDALEICRVKTPDLVLMDVRTDNNENGIAAAAKIRAQYPSIRIVIMTGMPEITYMDSARRAGVDSFLYKNINSETMLATIRSTMDGYRTFPREAPSVLPGHLSFTDTEIAILRLVCEAKSRKEIARELTMSEGSVKAVITDILNKTGYDSIIKFAVFAVSKGYIMPNA
ncbi:dna-binding response regulator, luxr family [hydrocarbon metagenome]|uniref:Dna-binding response regulator, luxr family n=1 Tax=hydrocarbon metagenome TaxID=938273 RepID=A0A0W8EAC0_9ZZZZ